MTLLLAYARERLTAGRLLPAVLLPVGAALAGLGWTSASAADVGADAAIALGLVVGFRIWDDLMDRDRDRAKHPDRVLVVASSTAPLQTVAAAIALSAACLLALTRGWASVLLLVAYTAVLAVSYATRGPRTAARDWILLLKYGAFTLALIGSPAAFGARGVLAGAAAFVAACLYEWWHDAESPIFSFGDSR